MEELCRVSIPSTNSPKQERSPCRKSAYLTGSHTETKMATSESAKDAADEKRQAVNFKNSLKASLSNTSQPNPEVIDLNSYLEHESKRILIEQLEWSATEALTRLREVFGEYTMVRQVLEEQAEALGLKVEKR